MTPRYVSLLTAPAAQTAPKLAALGCLKISPRGNARITQTGRDAIDAYRIAARHPSGHP
jgi:Mn-dependent DtxR family transcriptional regulator